MFLIGVGREIIEKKTKLKNNDSKKSVYPLVMNKKWLCFINAWILYTS